MSRSKPVDHTHETLAALAKRVAETATALSAAAATISAHDLGVIPVDNHVTAMRGLKYVEAFASRVTQATRDRMEAMGKYATPQWGTENPDPDYTVSGMDSIDPDNSDDVLDLPHNE